MLKNYVNIFVILLLSQNICAAKQLDLTKVGIKSTPGIKNSQPKPKIIKIVTSLEILAALAREIGGNKIIVSSLLKSSEDPHFVRAKPSFKSHVADADLFFKIGKSLELWAPQVINSSGNKKLISGSGVVNISVGVRSLEIPKKLTRNVGDIHPQGNPHIWLSSLAIRKVAQNILTALKKEYPKATKYFEQNYKNFDKKLAQNIFGEKVVTMFGSSLDRLYLLHQAKKLKAYLQTKNQSLGGWAQKLAQVKYNFFTYHSVFSYLADEFGLNILGYLEEKPGAGPTIAHQNYLVNLAQEKKITRIIAAKYYEGVGARPIKSLAEKMGGEYKFVQVDCLPKQSYFDFMGKLVQEIADFAPKIIQPQIPSNLR